MLDSIPFAILVGTILGFLSGLGIGGGSLLMLWLTVVLGMEHNTARGINLLFFLPGAAAAICFRWKQGMIRIKTVLPAILAGCIAAAGCAWIGMRLEMGLIQKLFGGLLVATGIRELLYKPKGRN